MPIQPTTPVAHPAALSGQTAGPGGHRREPAPTPAMDRTTDAVELSPAARDLSARLAAAEGELQLSPEKLRELVSPPDEAEGAVLKRPPGAADSTHNSEEPDVH